METVHLQVPFQPATLAAAARDEKVLAIGHFDGVHRGHRKVIELAAAKAKEKGLLSAVMTFHPHPREVLGRGEQYVASITPLHMKLALFAELGLDYAYVVHFDTAFASLLPQDFVRDVLQPLSVREAVVGFDFRFGHKGMGTPERLRELGAPEMTVTIMEPQQLSGEKISSSRIRSLLETGSVEEAEKLLGRRYEITGSVVRGEGRGRTIGFPTANVVPDADFIIPRQGVYAVYVELNGALLRGVMNVGVKPTFHHEGDRTIEVHLFDFTGDLYGKSIKLVFSSFLREERRFGSVQELIEQIRLDADQANKLLKEE